jgi:hypothetical protein
MRRSQRAVHRMLWPVLVLAIGCGVVLALAWRPPPPAVPQVEDVR